MQELRSSREFQVPAAVMPELLPLAFSRCRFANWTFGTVDGAMQSATAIRDTSTPGVLIRRESLQAVVVWESRGADVTLVSWNVFDYTQGQRGKAHDDAAAELGSALDAVIRTASLAAPPVHDPIVAPGHTFDGPYTGNLRDYRFCATPAETADFEHGALPLGVYAFGDEGATTYGKMLYLSEYRTGRPMLYNGVLVCAPQNSGKTQLIRRWAKAANLAGYNQLLVDVKGNMYRHLKAADWEGKILWFSTNPHPAPGEPESGRINLLAGYLDPKEGLTPVATDRIKQLAHALLPSEGWTGQGGKEEFQYRNRVIWTSALIHVLLLRQFYYPWTFKDCRRVTRACRNEGTEAARHMCDSMVCERTADLGDLYELAADERLLYRVIRELREAEAAARARGLPPKEPGVDYWLRELALLVDRNEFPEGNRPLNDGYQGFTAGIKQALEPFARHGTLHARVRDNGRGPLFRLDELAGDDPDPPVTIVISAREQDHGNAETVLALVLARVQQMLFDRMPLEDPRPVLLLLDEARRIRGFRANEYIRFAREAKAGCVVAYQSLDQIGEEQQIAEVLENVGTQVYLGSLVGSTAKHFIDILPKRYRVARSEQVQRSGSGITRTEMTQMELVDALTTNELFRLPAGRWPALVYVTDQPRRKPFLVDMDETRMPTLTEKPPIELAAQSFPGHAAAVRCLLFWTEGAFLVSAADDDTLTAWRLDDGAAALALTAGNGGARCAAVGSTGAWLAAGTPDGRVLLIDASSGLVVQAIEAHAQAVNALAFGPDDEWIASASDDAGVAVSWRASGDLIELLTGHLDSVTAVAATADRTGLISAGRDGWVRVWSTLDWSERAAIDTGSPVEHVAAGASGHVLVRVGNAASWWDPGAGTLTPVAEHLGAGPVAVSADGQLIALGTERGYEIRWAERGQLVATLGRVHAATVTALCFAPDGTSVASASEDGKVMRLVIAPLISGNRRGS